MSYFALVPKEKALAEDYNPRNDNRQDWLELNKADEMICKHFGVEPDKRWFYKSWKDFLYYSQSERSKAFIGTYSKHYIFKTIESYIRLVCFQNSSSVSINKPFEDITKEMLITYDDLMNTKGGRNEQLKVIYDAGYILVGVFNED